MRIIFRRLWTEEGRTNRLPDCNVPCVNFNPDNGNVNVNYDDVQNADNVAGYHNVRPFRERSAYGFKRLPSHNNGVSPREYLKAFKVVGDMEQKLPAISDGGVFSGDRYHDIDF